MMTGFEPATHRLTITESLRLSTLLSCDGGIRCNLKFLTLRPGDPKEILGWD